MTPFFVTIAAKGLPLNNFHISRGATLRIHTISKIRVNLSNKLVSD